MKKNRVIRILTLVLAIVLVLSLAGCGPKGKVKDVVEVFVEKANALDYQGIFDLMASDAVKEIRGNKSLADFLAEKSSEEIAAAIVKQIVPMEVSDPVKFLETLTFSYEGADIREDFSSLYATVTFEMDGQTVTKNAVFN
ncbi:MAG: hypothetical protein WC332_09845, partial [Clostridia bacterium]